MTAAPNYDASTSEKLVRALRQARHTSRCQADDLDRAKLELKATQARAAAFARQEETALLRVRTLEQILSCMQAEQVRLNTLPPAGPMERPATDEAGLHAAIALLAQHRDEANRLRQSLSWRITRPLRALRQPRRTLHILIDRLSRSWSFR